MKKEMPTEVALSYLIADYNNMWTYKIWDDYSEYISEKRPTRMYPDYHNDQEADEDDLGAFQELKKEALRVLVKKIDHA